MPSLRSNLTELATSFTDAVLEAIRSTSLEEILSESRGHSRGFRAGVSVSRGGGGRASSGRLPRRSAQDIANALDQIVALVKQHKDGLRAEQIRAELGLQAKELPRVLKEGLSTKMLRSKGQKRATTYFAK
jgi:hypothetical protein